MAGAFFAAAFLAGAAFFARVCAAFFADAARRAACGVGSSASGEECAVIHSSRMRQVVARAARPVSIPRWPPGTTSKRKSVTPVARSSIGRTQPTGAIPSLAPPKASSGAVRSAIRISRSSMVTEPPASWLPLRIRW